MAGNCGKRRTGHGKLNAALVFPQFRTEIEGVETILIVHPESGRTVFYLCKQSFEIILGQDEDVIFREIFVYLIKAKGASMTGRL